MTTAASDAQTAAQAFIDRWKPSGGAERANYQLFLTELCKLLDVPKALSRHRGTPLILDHW